MTDETIDPRAVEAARGVYDDEYEQSTPGAGRWRERIGAPRHDHGPTAGEISDDEVLGADARTTRLAQRHRFGRALDKPKVRSDLDDSRWLVWFALYLAAVAVALVVIWLVQS